ncbi:MAG TPA: hypothetical protein VNT30_15475 [Stellaceae bacterium]|nr:hypothetical protein [Stellaceae bacterium]
MALAIGLGGCSMFSSGPDRGACPRLAVAGDLAQLTEFKGPGQGVGDVAVTGQIRSFEGTCSFDGKGVTINSTVTIVGRMGPAAQGRSHDYTYFIAITDPKNTIVTEQTFTSPIQFPNGEVVGGIAEQLTERIPLPKDGKAQGYRVIIGFRLTPEQLAYNRQQRGS